MKRPLIVSSLAALMLTSVDAGAVVRRDGDWPAHERRVSLSLDGASRAEALRKVAEASGLSIVADVSDKAVSLHVKDQEPADVLEALLADGDYTLARKGTLVVVRRASDPSSASVAPAAPPIPAIAPPTPPTPPPPPTPPEPPAVSTRGDDRVVTGGKLRVEREEVLHDLTIMGGSADVLGTVTGDLTVLGGSARVLDGARVVGDATAIGGAIRIEKGAAVDGEAHVIGGALFREPGSRVNGRVITGSRVADSAMTSTSHGGRSFFGDALRAVSRVIVNTAMLFVLGAVLLALAETRSDKVLAEVAARPMKSFALGVVASLGAVVACCLLAVTLVGIPFAVIAALAGVFATFVGIAAVATTAGKALFGHKLKTPYAHLAVGLVMYMLLVQVPFVGGFVGFAVAMVGLGALVATRSARSRRDGTPPYRTAAA